MNLRNFQWADLPALVDLMNAYSRALGGGTISLDQVEPSWRSPYNHPERDCFIAFAPDSTMIGFTIADLLDDPDRANGVYTVLPGHRAIGWALIAAATDHFVQFARAHTPSDVPLTMQWRISDQDEDAIALLKEDGAELVRAFYTMRIVFDAPMVPPPLPEGFMLRPFTPADLEAVYAVKTEIFLDHWGEQDQPFEEWQADIDAPEFDPSLWWIVYHGDQIAGMLLSRLSGAHAGYVDIVGVRRAWRGHGLAYRLLRQCFAEFQQRGRLSVGLGVDTDNTTNAVTLYQRAGMVVQARQVYYNRVVR